MSISTTRKVIGSPSLPPRKTYPQGSDGGESFVEVIDTTNNVLVNNNDMENHKDPQESPYQKREETPEQTNLSTKNTYIPSAIEALSASGVYEENQTAADNRMTQNIGIYDNNQSMIKDNNKDYLSHNYLKHFYERNEIIEEIDELI